jgi:hypothetical protein
MRVLAYAALHRAYVIPLFPGVSIIFQQNCRVTHLSPAKPMFAG